MTEGNGERDRRRFLGEAAMAMTVGPLGLAAFGDSAAAMQRAAPTRAPSAGFAPLKRVAAGLLDVAYAEAGPADGPPVILLHGWPYDIYSFAEATPLLAARGFRVIVPFLRGFGDTRFRAADTIRNGQPAALAQDLVDLMDAFRIRRAILAGFDWGARTADIVAALWPDRVAGLVAVSGYLIGSQAAGAMPLPPEAELQWWYQYYFATERGRLGYAANTRDFNRLIWRLASPRWNFSDQVFARSAASFDNPDHVAIVIHNYRWRLGLAEGERRYDEIETRLAAAPVIAVPSITMEGDANGAPHPPPEAYRSKFSGRYEHRALSGGIGHNLPQEAPRAFAQAVIDVAGMRQGE
jgi:pimeloyl-ACP methyl ester carboxylesterase